MSARAASAARLRPDSGPCGPGVPAHDHVLPARPQVDVAVGPRAASVRGRAQLTQEAQLLEPGLELRAEHAPLDPVERAERRLHRRPLALGAEVRAQPRPQVARPADVEHLPRAVEEEIDAGPLGGAEGERALGVDAARRASRRAPAGRRPSRRHAPARARSGRAGSPPSLRRRAARGGTDARSCRRTARARRARRARCARRAADARAPTVSITGAAIRLPVSRSVSRSRKREVEARVVRDEHGVARRTRGTAAPRPRHGRRRAGARGRRSRSARRRRARAACPGWRASRTGAVSSSASTRTAPISQIRAVAGESPVVSRSTTQKRASSSGRLSAAGSASPTRSPRHASRASRANRLVEQPARDPVGKPPEREEPPRRLLGRHRSAPLLDELDEPVGGVQAKLHADDTLGERMFDYKRDSRSRHHAATSPSGATQAPLSSA